MALYTTTLSTHALTGGPVAGQVLDQSTGKPLRDAIVVVHWRGRWPRLPVESTSACYHVETARTDANGRYHIAAWKRPWSPSDLVFTSEGQTYGVYKPGYTWEAQASGPGTFYMAPYKGSRAWYFEHVLSAPYWCDRAGASRKNAYRLLQAMAEEAEALAETPQQHETASWRRRLARDSLVHPERPTAMVNGELVNTDPQDSFKAEEVPQ